MGCMAVLIQVKGESNCRIRRKVSLKTGLLNLHRYGVPMLDLSMDELESDLANA